MILNLGCGGESYGDVRVDFTRTATTTNILDLNKKLPFKDEMFDEVYAKSVLEHIGNVKLFIDEAIRVLKVGGTIWIRTDNANYLPFLFKNHQDYITNKYSHYISDDKHYYLFKKEHLNNIFNLKLQRYSISFTCPSKKLFFLPNKLKCMHIELRGIK